MSNYLELRKAFLEELNKKIDLKEVEKFPAVVVEGKSYPYLSIMIGKNHIYNIDIFLENNVSVVLDVFYYEGEDFVLAELERHLEEKFKIPIKANMFPKNDVKEIVGIIANRTLNSFSLNFSFDKFKSFEELYKFTLKLVKEVEDFLNKKGIALFNSDNRITEKLEKLIGRI